MPRSRRQSMLLMYLAPLIALAALIPRASFVAVPVSDPARAALESIRQILWPTRIEPGPASLPHSAAFLSGSGGADALLLSDRFRLISAADGWFRLRGGGADIAPIYEQSLAGQFSVFNGQSDAQLLPRYSRVRFPEVYAGIDLVYYVAASRELQFDFLIAAGANPARIKIDVPRDADVYLSRGSAQLRHGSASLRLAAPVAWQTGPRGRTPVDVEFTLEGHALGFALGDYDLRLPLVIDPLVVTDSTFLGSDGNEDTIQAMTVDARGNLYLTGTTQFQPGVTGTFPSTPGSFIDEWRPPSPCAFNCLFVLKLTPDYQVSYGAFIPQTMPAGIAVTRAGEAVVAGTTSLGADFPWTSTVFSREPSGQAFVLKLDATGAALKYAATFRAQQANAVALRTDGAAVVVGTANLPGLPTTPSALKPAYQPSGDVINEDGFVLTVSADGKTLLAGTYLGGLLSDSATAVSVDAHNRLVVGGSFRSSDMVGMRGAPVGEGDVFLACLSADLSRVISHRLFGGDGSEAINALTADPKGGYLLAGGTTSTNLPVTVGAFQNSKRGDQNGWVARVDENFASRYFTYFGGEFYDGVTAVATDPQGNAYVAGTGFSRDIPTTADAFQDVTSLGLREGYFAVLNPAGDQLSYSTYLGGAKSWPRFYDVYTGAWAVARAPDGRVYVGGSTQAATFPVTGNSLRSGMGGLMDAFLVRFEDSTLTISSPSLLQPALTNAAYSQQLTATGGRAPYAWSLASFQLPDGLKMSAAGLISGTTSSTQTEADEYQFSVAVRDADGRVAHKSFFIGISYPGSWFCENGACSMDLATNQSLVYQMPEPREGQPPFTYSVAGSLPAGITVSPEGSLTGAATGAGTSNAAVNITDWSGATRSINLRFVVTDPSAPAPPPSGGSSSGASQPGTGVGSASGAGRSNKSGGRGAFGSELLFLGALVAMSAASRRRTVQAVTIRLRR